MRAPTIAMAVALFLGAGMAADAGEHLRAVLLRVEGLTCPSCAYSVKAALEKLPGVHRAKVSWEKGEAVVEFRDGVISAEQMIEAVNKAGYPAHLPGAAK